MRNTSLAAASVLLMILHSPLVRADDQLPPPIAAVNEFLQLSSEQTEALMTILQTREAAIQPIARQMRANQETLGKLLEASNPDPNAAGQLLIQIHEAEKQIAAVAQQAAASFEAALDIEQQQRLQFARQAAQIAPVIPAFKAIGLL